MFPDELLDQDAFIVQYIGKCICSNLANCHVRVMKRWSHQIYPVESDRSTCSFSRIKHYLIYESQLITDL